jgi:plastocyanin
MSVRGARIRRTALTLTVAAAAGAAALTGLGVAATKPPAVRSLSSTGNELAYNVDVLRVPAGPVKLVYRNRSELAHNVALRGRKLAKPRIGKVVPKGRGSVVKFANLPAGRYTFYCSVFGHESGGMKGKLTVTKRRS